MEGPITNDYISTTRKSFVSNDNDGKMIENNFIEIEGTFLVKIRDNAFNGNDGENVFKHINSFLKVAETHKFYNLFDHDEEKEVEDNDDPNMIDDVPEIFEIEDNLFNFDTPLCIAFKEFNYLLKIDPDLFTYDIQGIKTYNEYEQELNNDKTQGLDEKWSMNGVPYQLCDHICEPYRFKDGITKWPTCSSDTEGFCNRGELPGMVRVGRMTYFQDHEWYDNLTDGCLKQETLMYKAQIEGSWGNATLGVMKNNETNNGGNIQEGHRYMENLTHEPSASKIRRFEMTKYTFEADEEYVAVKELEHINHSETNIDARANSSGSSFWNVKNSSTTHIMDKIRKFENLIINGQAILMDEAGNPLKKVEYPGDHDSEDEVASVDNDMTHSLASKKTRFSTQSLLEQRRDSYGNGDYDEDPNDDDMYEGQDHPGETENYLR
ncbi:hypothetical protein Tco_0622576 [Tanacetum coccineum]